MNQIQLFVFICFAFAGCSTSNWKTSLENNREGITRGRSTDTLPSKAYFDSLETQKGCVVLMEFESGTMRFVNKALAKTRFTPMSTFKILNSLIGLETGVITDERHVIKWDGKTRERKEWNNDLTLQSAFQYSAFPYYQEIARQVGSEKMKAYIDKTGYGNGDTTGGIDWFWLRGGLKISAYEQVEFLRRLFENKLPFSQRSIDIVKKIMQTDATDDYRLWAKPGGGTIDKEGREYVGWYVGFLQKANKTHGFAVCVFGESFATIQTGRSGVLQKVLRDVYGVENANLR